VSEAGERAVLVCGLGRLGRLCVATLAEFGVPLHAIDVEEVEGLDAPELSRALQSFTAGDFRRPAVLSRAGVEQCRAVLLVASDERANVAGAFAVRRLNAEARIVIRSAQADLNDLLAAQLGNFVAFEPMQLAAPAFALAALGVETIGLFRVHGRIVRLRRHAVGHDAAWNGRTIAELSTGHRRVLGRRGADSAAAGEPRAFHEEPADARLATGDVVTTVEIEDESAAAWDDARSPAWEPSEPARAPLLARASGALAAVWRGGTQMQRVAAWSMGALLLLFVAGVFLFKAEYPDISVRDALNVATVLVLGGYDNLFGQLRLPFPIAWWLHAFSVLLTVAGTLATGIVYGFITERIVSMRLQSPWQRQALPRRGHVVLFGAGRLARETAQVMQRMRCRVVSIGEAPIPEARVPHVTGPPRDAMVRAGVEGARSLMALTDDEVANLGITLAARRRGPRCTLVLRSDDAHFSENVAKLVPGLRAIGVYGPAAEAFAAAAFGENVFGLTHLEEQTVLVVEYEVERGDTLEGRLVGEAAYGYGIVPLLLARGRGSGHEAFPSDDLRLEPGDRLTALATVEALRDVERGRARPRGFVVHLDAALSKEAAFDGAMTVARITGCEVAHARTVLTVLPVRLDVPLYEPQAQRLVRELAKVRVTARVDPAGS
jgi:Trk K+ transport system NAD-binding subunit